tara:strand:+ start:6623 stop:6790 length:168 start_codon:yes stop_codon:yes gene_type:complete
MQQSLIKYQELITIILESSATEKEKKHVLNKSLELSHAYIEEKHEAISSTRKEFK